MNKLMNYVVFEIKELIATAQIIIEGYEVKRLIEKLIERKDTDLILCCNKAIWFFEKWHYKMSALYKEAVEKDLKVSPKLLTAIDMYNAWIFDIKQDREILRNQKVDNKVDEIEFMYL